MKMSKAYDLISESLNEIIKDLEDNDGKNLRRETIAIKKHETKNLSEKKIYNMNHKENFLEESAIR